MFLKGIKIKEIRKINNAKKISADVFKLLFFLFYEIEVLVLNKNKNLLVEKIFNYIKSQMIFIDKISLTLFTKEGMRYAYSQSKIHKSLKSNLFIYNLIRKTVRL